MNKDTAQNIAASVVNFRRNALIGMMNANGHPNIKFLDKIKNEDLKTIYFTTLKDSNEEKQMKNNNKGCIYFIDPMRSIEVILEGNLELTTEIDKEVSEYYDLKDLRIIKFTTKTVIVSNQNDKLTYEL